MNEERSEDLTRHERTAFGSLAEKASPPPGCEETVVAALKESGLIRPRAQGLAAIFGMPALPRFAMAGGALAIAFFLGVQYGKTADEPGPPEAYLEAGAEEQEATPAPAPGGGMMATAPAQEDVIFAAAADWDKPRLGADDPDYESFPPYPLDGRTRTVSSRPR